jgi:hydroxymethylpyrimidine/phosphomethylpyrimidine kinase
VKHVLTIAGSDSSGGAGIQADLKTFSALGTYGMSVICAVTAQNTRGVRSYRSIERDLIEEQIDAVFSDIRVDAVKIGMLGAAATIDAVAGKLREYAPPVVVLDPVMVAKSGHRLLEGEAESALLDLLVPLATLVTPNLSEAAALSGFPVTDEKGMRRAAEFLKSRGAKAVLVKGGHLASSADDALLDESGYHVFRAERIDARHTHGTGCSLSSALAAFLARGLSLHEAAASAKAWVAGGIREGLAIGGGCGPIHHFHEFYDAEGVRL